MLVLAPAGEFSTKAGEQYPNIEPVHKDQLASYFMMKLLQDKALKKAQDEAQLKQQELTKTNLRKNNICIEKEKLKKSALNQRYVENLLKLK